MLPPSRYVLITPDGSREYQDYGWAIMGFKNACLDYDAALLIQFGGQMRSRRIAEKWARDGWRIYAERPPPAASPPGSGQNRDDLRHTALPRGASLGEAGCLSSLF